MKITLYLMTKKGYDVLNALIEQHFHSAISEIVVGRDRNIDSDFADAIVSLCKHNNIMHFERNAHYEISSDYSIAISWRWLISDSTSKLIVLHDSILPEYRGFAPLVNMLINREPRIGVSAIYASDEYDKGDIIAQSSTEITYPIQISDAINLISRNYIGLISDIFSTLLKGDVLTAVRQNEDLASYSLWRDENDYLIDWQKDSTDILAFINAVASPYRGAATYINGSRKVRILEAAIVDDERIENRDVGKTVFIKDKCPIIVCGSGLLKLLKVIDDDTHEDILPFKNFRVRLTGCNIGP